jgi:hypothetical protein
MKLVAKRLNNGAGKTTALPGRTTFLPGKMVIPLENNSSIISQ